MYDTFDFFGSVLLGTFLGSLATLIYHVRQIRQEARQNYLRLSLAQAEVTTLERTLEILRGNSIADFTQPIQKPTVPESEAPNTLPLIPPWMRNSRSGREDSTRRSRKAYPPLRIGSP